MSSTNKIKGNVANTSDDYQEDEEEEAAQIEETSLLSHDSSSLYAGCNNHDVSKHHSSTKCFNS